MRKRIVLCLDGTWNQVRDPHTVTNIVKLARAGKPTYAPVNLPQSIPPDRIASITPEEHELS